MKTPGPSSVRAPRCGAGLWKWVEAVSAQEPRLVVRFCLQDLSYCVDMHVPTTKNPKIKDIIITKVTGSFERVATSIAHVSKGSTLNGSVITQKTNFYHGKFH